MRAMIDIDISDALQHPGREYTFVYEGQPAVEDIALGEPVQINAKYSLEGDALRVRGSVQTEVSTECSRCLTDMLMAVDETFDEIFVDRPKDDEQYTFNRIAKRASLDQLVRDILVTEIPMQTLCREDCRGICPTCGADLNNGPCGCVDEPAGEHDVNNPFARLKDLL